MLLLDDDALVTHMEDALQRLIYLFDKACEYFGLTVNMKKTNIMGQNVSNDPHQENAGGG
ncbi:hypothetical protein DPMN_127637 [Dreissena polymorpha]|uniref:Uncharacterized protein n=1 Tax=Dreissena polymorpha TaxID=45954 RepID=A0A9D4JVM6_DREPO|nr:hypothetical protein DPMN_127637 [Dreissena polymorpha]